MYICWNNLNFLHLKWRNFFVSFPGAESEAICFSVELFEERNSIESRYKK